MGLPWKDGGALAIDSHNNFPDVRKNWTYERHTCRRRVFAALPGMVIQRSGYPRKRDEKGRSAGGTEQNASQCGYNMKQDI